MKMPDIDELIIATDAGREGELVARWIIQKAGWHKPIKRLWISSQTDQAIKEGFNNLRPGSEYERLYASAECRAEADWLVGLNVTRALTCKYNAQLSAGRVQTPTLAMVVAREEEIKKFVPKDYWTVQVATNGFSLQWQDKATARPGSSIKPKLMRLLPKLPAKTAKCWRLKKKPKKNCRRWLMILPNCSGTPTVNTAFLPKPLPRSCSSFMKTINWSPIPGRIPGISVKISCRPCRNV